jgi:hypothetical protein
MGDRPYFLCPRPWREGLPKSVSPPLEGGDEGEGVISRLFCHCSTPDGPV